MVTYYPIKIRVLIQRLIRFLLCVIMVVVNIILSVLSLSIKNEPRLLGQTMAHVYHFLLREKAFFQPLFLFLIKKVGSITELIAVRLSQPR